MAIRMTTIFKNSSMYYSLEELVNKRIRTIEEEHGEIVNIQVADNNTAHIIYKI